MVGRTGDVRRFAHADEAILVLPNASVKIAGHEASDTLAPAASIILLPPGSYAMTFEDAGEAYLFSTARLDAKAENAVNAAAYQIADAHVAPLGAPFRRVRGDNALQVLPIASIAAPEDNKRLKFLQSATMSINWVEYDGPRDRTSLSPHHHEDFEQGSLAISGTFIHHLRMPWGRNADHWREDEHIHAEAGTMLVIPPHIVHTSEGIGEGKHVLIDIFAPPRRDFIRKNWVFNASDYVDVAARD
jgi:mannose-6-phosphate isomerase-like protein (cupin superfamily)